jgi:hypothetical protein
VRKYGFTVNGMQGFESLLRDPDGNRIEILQWVRPYDPPADGRFSA